MLILRDNSGYHTRALLKALENKSLESLVQQLKYLNGYGVNAEDCTRVVVVVHPSHRLNEYYAVQWWYRQGNTAITETAITSWVNAGGDLWASTHKFREHYKMEMNGGLIYHQSSNEWSVHT